MIQKPYLFNLHNIHPSTGEFPHTFAKRKRLSQILDPIFRGFRSTGCMSFAPLVGKEVFFCFSLDIQSYLLRFGVLCIFADPNTFSTSVWMSREKEKINQEQPKHRFSCWEQKSWMEFSLCPLKMDVVSKNDCSTGNGWLDPPTPNAPCLEYFDPRKLTWIPQMIISKRPFWKVYSMLDFWGAPTFTVNFWANVGR